MIDCTDKNSGVELSNIKPGQAPIVSRIRKGSQIGGDGRLGLLILKLANDCEEETRFY